ncbi:MAG TPA: hypothetical protein VG458_07605 [Solirubrobacterales bacterium]|nr:hypothetical protein [Solirubrobacterales bacterium]
MANERYGQIEIEKVVGSEKVEGEVGTAKFFVPATEIGFVPNPALLDRSDEIRNIDGRVTGAKNDYAPTGSVVMRGYANYLGVLLYMLFGDVTTTEGDGVAVKDPDEVAVPKKAWKHVFKKKTGATPKTARMTLAYFDKWIRARGVSCNSLAFALADDGVKATGQLMANYLSRLTVDPAAEPKPDALSILPFRRRNVQVTTPSLAATALLNSIDFSMEQSLEAVRTMGSMSGWPQATERANSPEGFLRLQGSLSRRDFDPVDWDALIEAAVFSIIFKFQSEQPIAEVEGGTYPYGLWVATEGAQFTGGSPETLKQQARHESSFDWQAGTSETGVNDFTVTLVNGTKSYTA